jgi:hypothetical protein
VAQFGAFHVKQQWWWEVVAWPVQGNGSRGAVCLRRRKAGGGVGCQKPKTELPWLGFGSAVSNSVGERWSEVVAWPVQGDGGRGAVCLQMRGGGWGWVPKTPKPSCHGLVSGLPCQTATVEGGGGIAHTRWQWPWGSPFTNARWGVGLGAKNLETELPWLGFRSTMSNSDGGRWEVVVVVWPIQGNGGRGVVCLQMRGGRWGWVPKTPN